MLVINHCPVAAPQGDPTLQDPQQVPTLQVTEQLLSAQTLKYVFNQK
jgi:hypothetical protein